MHSRRSAKVAGASVVPHLQETEDGGTSVDSSKWKAQNSNSERSVMVLFMLCVMLIAWEFLNHNQEFNTGEIGNVTQSDPLQIPECESSPWKPDEDLVGTCPGRPRALNTSIHNPVDCAKSCCFDPNCIVWQFRDDTGCLQGGDVRIGQEKDGPAAYCSDHPPLRWKGQKIQGRKDTECSSDSWHPDEQPGQCFGLGDVRRGIQTAEECRDACCLEEICGAWQFEESLGCFYNTRMHSCQRSDDPIVFTPFVGRRKKLNSRTYSGRNKIST